MRAIPRWLLLLPFAGAVQSASFDCAKAATMVEKLVCADAALSAQDDVLAATYRQAASLSKPDDSEPKTSQRAWLKQRNACADAACIAAAYRSRIAELEDAIGQDLSTEAIAGTYVRRDANISEELAPAEISIEALPDARVALKGEAVWIADAAAGNVNTGSLEGEFELRGGTVEYGDGDDEWSCALTLRFARDSIDVYEPRPTCGGNHVSFGGHYVRR